MKLKRALLLLAIWAAAAIFPFGWLTQFSDGYARAFNSVFDYELAHIVMHAFIFAGLGVLLTLAFGRPLTWRRVLLVAAAVTLVALAQESAQLWYKERAWGGAEWFDLATDWTGGLLGTTVATLALRLASRRASV